MNWLRYLTLPVLVVGVTATLSELAQAQITTGGDGTTLTPNGTTIDITGGTQTGSNLFHSFGQFNVDAGQTANFINPGVQNILGRVTGGNASLINGVLQVSGGNANLYLMNPAGIVFGANASLNVSGSFTATTANGIGFGNQWFNAIGSNDYPNLIGTPDKLAFTMAQPGSIVNAADLAVGTGKRLMLAGGTVISTGTLIAPEGHVVVTSVPGSSLVQITEAGKLLRLEVQPLTAAVNQPLPWTENIPSLPALLTGGGLGNATGLTVNADGSVSLVGSGLKVEQGDIVITQPIVEIRQPNGTIVRAAPSGITMNSDRRIITGDIEARVAGGDQQVTIDITAKGDIYTGAISSDFQLGETNLPGIFKGVKLLSKTGNIGVQSIYASVGDIDVTAAGLFQAYGSLGITPASGVFDPEQAYTRNPNGFITDFLYGYKSKLEPYLEQDPAALAFFLNKTGLTQTELKNALTSVVPPNAYIPTPVSVYTFLGNITIRHGNGSSLTYGNPSGGLGGNPVFTAIGNAPFVIGPNVIPRSGDLFIPANPNDNFSTFGTSPFDVIRNENYTLLTLPAGVSGTRGAIVRGVSVDGTLFTSLQGVVLGTLPAQPCESCGSNTTNTNSNNAAVNPAVDRIATLRQQFQGQDGQVTQRQLNAQGSSCAAPSTIASVAGVTRSSDRSSQAAASSTSNSPCNPTTDASTEDAQILKLLDGGVK